MMRCSHKVGLGVLVLEHPEHGVHHAEAVRRFDDERAEVSCCCGTKFIVYLKMRTGPADAELFHFTVSGKGRFPIEGLAASRSSPNTPTDAMEVLGKSEHRLRTVTLVATEPPDTQWWANAGWPVAEVRGPEMK